MNHGAVHDFTLIGSGTYGRVYTARRNDTNEVVVVKTVPLAGLSTEDQIKTLDESRLMAAVDHPNIIKYFGTDVYGDSLEIFMEYASGGDLAGIISRARANREMVSERVIWIYFLQLAHALQHIHSKRMMHRDIKPQNIFLDADGNVKIGDFGLGRMFGPQSICAVSTVGTPLYFSPELCEGREYNEKSDVWALGCVLFELAALSPPFVSNNAIALGRMITTVLPPRLPRTYTADLEDVIFQMLDKDPGRRPSIDALLELPSVLLRQQAELLRRRAQSGSGLVSGDSEAAVSSELKRELETARAKAKEAEDDNRALRAKLHALEESNRRLTAAAHRAQQDCNAAVAELGTAKEAWIAKDAKLKAWASKASAALDADKVEIQKASVGIAARAQALCDWEVALRECHHALTAATKRNSSSGEDPGNRGYVLQGLSKRMDAALTKAVAAAEKMAQLPVLQPMSNTGATAFRRKPTTSTKPASKLAGNPSRPEPTMDANTSLLSLDSLNESKLSVGSEMMEEHTHHVPAPAAVFTGLPTTPGRLLPTPTRPSGLPRPMSRQSSSPSPSRPVKLSQEPPSPPRVRRTSFSNQPRAKSSSPAPHSRGQAPPSSVDADVSVYEQARRLAGPGGSSPMPPPLPNVPVKQTVYASPRPSYTPPRYAAPVGVSPYTPTPTRRTRSKSFTPSSRPTIIRTSSSPSTLMRR